MTPQGSKWQAAFVLLPLFACLSTAWMNERPVLEVRDGNLFITSAKDKNITLLTTGASYINVNEINLLRVATSAHAASQLVERWKSGVLAEIESSLSRLTETIEGPSGLLSRVNTLQFGTGSNDTSSRPDRFPGLRPSPGNDGRIRRLTVRVRQVETEIANLRRKLETNECASNPCQNGGTCEDIMDGYKCHCTEGWEGPACITDVNECARYAGTDLGCQNGATCRNLPGTYQCVCKADWFGIHCTQNSKDCNNQNSNELCGHGICLNKPGSSLGYTCLCEQGWQPDGTNPACVKDVDECAQKHHPCSTNPLVPCINVPGTYQCGGCPQGYSGTGYYCTDIDECATNNGGCSITPFVQCINTMGSRMCGSCPSGFQGDGVTCTYVGSCRINNGGCHPLATCINNPGMSDWYVQCRCPAGYQGDGMGPTGCVINADTSVSVACSSNPCSHGTCTPNGPHGYACRCEPGFTGTNCNILTNPCDPNPCKNGGTCSVSDVRTAVCRCTRSFSGPLCATQRASCGEVIRDPAGTLQFPSNGNTYPSGLSCAWVLITNSSSVLNVTFSAFNLEQSADCEYDFLQIHNGPTAGEQMIGRYCGNKLPYGGNIISSVNALYLWFHSDNSISHDGFTLEWNSVAPFCGGEINADHGSISSPGSPGRYPPNRDCRWRINVTPGNRIQFNFFSIMLEEHPTCGNDYLEISDGLSESSRQFGLYCNHTHPSPLIISDDEAWVHFHSDSSGQDFGFQITFSSIPGVDGCGGVYTASSGRLNSPNFHDGGYDSQMNCEWKIQLPIGERIQITWLNFELEESSVCRFDFVEIYDGLNREAPMIGRYCGITMPPNILSSSNVLLVRFKSDWSYNRQGFKLNYEVWCGGDFTEQTGVIKSPYYPNNYPASRTCIYKVIQPPGKRIELTIADMDIEGWDYPDCEFDRLEIRDGDNEDSTKLNILCGSNSSIPEFPIRSTHNYMWLKFKADGSIHQRGFMATYTTMDSRCGGILNERIGVIQSPLENGRYSNEEDCIWIIQAPPGFVIQLHFHSFDLESHDSCHYDYVKISENVTATSQQDLGTYCGSTIPHYLMTQSRIMSIKFHTDNSRTRDGFMASYIFIDASKICGGHMSSLTGVLTSPNYPNRYPENRKCEWIINAPNRHQVLLNIKKFDLENQTSSCTYDYLEIRNGGSASSPLLGIYCGRNIPSQIKSFSNQLYLKFKTDETRSGTGFQIEWDSTIIGCGGTLNSTSSYISSPNYPQPYHHLAECTWKIRVSAGSIIQFVITDLELEDSRQCFYDYIEFYEGPDTRHQKLGKYCGPQHPPLIQTTSNLATIRFRSDSSSAGRGFHVNYQAICHKKLNGFRGVIESPNFPNNYPNRANCSWTIEAPLGNKLNLTFSHFDLEEGGDDSCPYDYLTIKEGDEDKATNDLARLCDSSALPPKIVSTQRQVFLQFISDSWSANNGFRLEWVVNGCGGILTRPEGTITSPGYPKPYPENVDCEWNIEVDDMHSIEITLVKVLLEKVQTCSFDKLSIYSGANDAAPKLIETCHVDKPVVLTSTSHKLFIRFHADFSYQNIGFEATYKSVAIRCGGKFTAPTGLIHSTNYPQNYPATQNCEWLIQVPENHLVNLTFVDFDIENTRNCTDDYVRIYDGSNRDAPVLGSHCHNRLPPPYISTSNELLVVMRTDSYLSAKGFKATYDLACGARIVTNNQGIIAMDPAVGLHTDIINCTWTIVAENLEDHVTLTLTHIQVESLSAEPNDCSVNSVQVFEGDGTDGPSRGIFCNTKVPPPITSVGNALTIHSSTLYGSLYNLQFSATYSVLNSACGGNYTSESGTIATPGYPDSYPQNIECVWYLRTSPGSSLSLSFTEFDIVESDNCDADYVEVREESGAGKLVGVYCGQNVNATTSTKSLWIKFRSSGVGTKKGFVADFSLLHSSTLSGPTGEIASPLYPIPFLLDGEYNWRILVDFGSSIQITFKEFHIEQYSDECYISLIIYDGYDDGAPVLMSKCGMILPEIVRSSSNIVYITFSSSLLRYGSWFLFSWLQVPKDNGEGPTEVEGTECHEIIALHGPNNSSYQFHSPGWPHGYSDNLDCNWIFESPPGTHLVLGFEKLEVEESMQCSRDFVRVFTGNSPTSQRQWSQIGQYCDRNATALEAIHVSNLMKVNFQSDYSVNKTGFRAVVYKVCGGQLYRPNGVIEFNSTTTTDPSNSWYAITCQWNVTVNPGKTIEVKFISLDIPSTSEHPCADNYLMLKNGGSASSPLLGYGKYCQNSVSEPLQTTGNQLYVKFSGQKSSTRFKLTYREMGINCGGEIILSEALREMEIQTPNYPNIPSPHTECVWTIMAPAGEQIVIHFKEIFDLTSSSTCETEYLEVKDGGTESSMLLKRLCGDKQPSSISTTGNMMHLHFYTNVHDPKNGFKGVVSIDDHCGGFKRARQGVLQSPNYPQIYPSNLSCVWHIFGPAGHTIKLEFQAIDLPWSCENRDYVEITEQVPLNDTTLGTTTQQLGRYCGRVNPGVIETSGNEVTVTFTSQNRSSMFSNHKGFKLNFTTSLESCGGDVVDTAGEIKSPGYPSYGQNHRRSCSWKLKAPEGYRIQLDILDIDLSPTRPGTGRGSRSPILHLYNDYHSVSRIKILRPTDTERQFFSTTNVMMVWYWSGSGTSRGFKASYSHVPSLCGSVLTNDHGTLLSNQSPISNLTSFACTWKAQSPSMNLTSETLALTVSGVVGSYHSMSPIIPCGYRGFNILVENGGKKIHCFSRNVSNEIVTIRSPLPVNTITITKGTPVNFTDNFNISYRWHPCGGILSGPSNTISAPKTLPHPIDCTWHAKFPDEAQSILLNFKKLNLRCPNNYIIVRNGGSSSPEIDKYCGSIIPSNITSQSNQLWIEYHAEDSNNEFELQLDSRQGGCGGLIQGIASSEISSPGFPSQYPNNAECMWEIVVENGYHIGLVFVDRFNLETSSSCSNDFIQVFDWREDTTTGVVSWLDLGKACGRNTPNAFNSTSNRMRILFRSNNGIQGDGFHARWNVNCGGTLLVSKETKYVTSPGWPIKYKRNLYCNYTFLAPEKELIVEFTDFEIEGPRDDCRYDNVSIIVSGNEYHTIPAWCGTNRPPMQRATSRLELHFQTDEYVQRKGFQIKYHLDECGGSITRPTEIKSPSLDETGNYYSRINCTWIVTAPPGKAVVLRFENFHLENNRQCFFDYVAVYSGLTIAEKARLALLCGSLNESLPVVRSENGTMTINFITDRTFHYGGFKAQIVFATGIADGCGGDIQLSQSQTFRTQRGAMYESFEDCHWLIQVPSNNVIKLTITSFDLKNSSSTINGNTAQSCSGDYLEIRDGRGPFSELIGQYCGDVNPPPITSSTNTLWIRLMTDGTVNGNGATARLENIPSLCGNTTLIVGNTTKQLTSPHFPATYPPGLRCRWKLLDSEGSTWNRFTVHFVQFDLGASSNCSKDVLSISNKNNRKYIMEGFGEDLIFNGAHDDYRFSWMGTLVRSSNPTYSYCGSGIPHDYHSTGGNVEINFKSSESPQGRHSGFKLEYSLSTCNRNFTGAQGRIVHQDVSECWFTITAPVGYTISIYFNEFMSDYRSSDCVNSALQVYDGDFGNNTLALLCGTTISNPIFSYGNKLSFHSWSHGDYVHETYDITYTTTDKGRGCGGKLFNYGGEFTSPLYPAPYRNTSQCTWEVSVPTGSKVVLDFKVFDLGVRGTCETVFIEFTDVQSDGRNSPSTRYCGEDNPAKYHATTDQVLVKYHTSVNNGGTGWILGFEAEQHE